MKKKSFAAFFTACLFVAVLWLSGFIPKAVGKMYAIHYVERNFPKMEFHFLNIEWSPQHDEYIILFQDSMGESYSFTLGPKLFPIVVGQGVFAIEEEYRERF